MSVNEKKIVVVGGSGTIGRELCIRLVIEGAEICVADLDLKVWEEHSSKRLTHEQQKRVHSLQVDCNDTVSVQKLISDFQEKVAAINAVVNCSYPRAPGFNKSVEDLSYEEFTENLKVHLGSYFLVTKEFALAMKRSGGGSIVNFSSIYGSIAPRFELYAGTEMVSPISYAAIKAGVIHSSRYFAKYFKGSGVRVNCISPGGILDSQPKQFLEKYNAQCLTKGMLDPQDVFGAVIFLLSDSSAYVNGQNLVVDDGFTL